MLHQPFFYKGPESFNAVDIDVSLFKLVFVVYIEMAISAEHERIVLSPFIKLLSHAGLSLRFHSLAIQLSHQ